MTDKEEEKDYHSIVAPINFYLTFLKKTFPNKLCDKIYHIFFVIFPFKVHKKIYSIECISHKNI